MSIKASTQLLQSVGAGGGEHADTLPPHRDGGRANVAVSPGRHLSPSSRRAKRSLCPCCGQPVIPAGLTLPRLDAVRARPGISAADLRAIAWGDDPNGGPEDRKVLHVHVWQLNRLIAPLRICVRGSVSGGYRITFAGGRS